MKKNHEWNRKCTLSLFVKIHVSKWGVFSIMVAFIWLTVAGKSLLNKIAHSNSWYGSEMCGRWVGMHMGAIYR